MTTALLIASQDPNATRVAGYGQWRRLGRQVRRGEHGIAILAPIVKRAPASERRASRAGDADESPGTMKVLAGFRVAHVFDVAQTDGEALPDVVPEPLVGTAPGLAFESMEQLLRASGWNLLRADCRPANGKTHFLSRTVVVGDDLSPAQVVKTLAHELAHTHLHHGSEYQKGCRGIVEVEAESVAYLLCAAFGLSTGAYTFAYVARWADGDVELVRKTATRVVGAAGELLSRLTGPARGDDHSGEQVTAEMTA